ncbi:MAG TPA: zinc-dependent metalloprotease, partial [Chitinophagaceae bacterium]|nr:zinc-dependent metalloprotease [Chitinophagaceae bacterium]
GYTYTGETNDLEDKKIVSQWIVDSLKANPRLWFGGEGLNFDARCQTEDVGDNSMKASEYGVKNLKYVMKHLPEWTKEDNDLYTNMLGIYRQVSTQFLRYTNHVAANVATVHETWKTVEQPGDVYTRASKAKQKEAVAFLQKEVFTTPTWLLDNEILNKISNPVRVGSVSTIQARALDQALSDRVLNTLLKAEERFGKEGTYTLIEYLDDLKGGIWSELKTKKQIDIYRRNLQKNYVLNMLALIKETKENSNVLGMMFGVPEEMKPIINTSDIGSYLVFHLQNLRQEILTILPSVTDKETKDHLKYVTDQIKTEVVKYY